MSMTIDWRALEEAVEGDNFADIRRMELWEQHEEHRARVGWEPEYVHALQKSIEGKDHERLMELLSSGKALHPLLLPLVSHAMHLMIEKRAGRSRALTDRQAENVRTYVKMLLAGPVMGVGDAQGEAAKQWKVSIPTIKRALKPPKS